MNDEKWQIVPFVSGQSVIYCVSFLFAPYFVPLLRTLHSLIDWFITSFFTFVTHLFYRLFACFCAIHLFICLFINRLCVCVGGCGCVCVCLGGPFLIIFHHSLIRSFVLHWSIDLFLLPSLIHWVIDWTINSFPSSFIISFVDWVIDWFLSYSSWYFESFWLTDSSNHSFIPFSPLSLNHPLIQSVNR